MAARKVGNAWEVVAPAKLNLYLEVLGKRIDGFHELETLMVPVRIYDQLTWSAEAHCADHCSLSIDSTVSNNPPLSAGPDNLVLRAAYLVAERANIEPRGHFHLVKRIPMKAGLGGGSSDAAATLFLANSCWEAGLSQIELVELAVELGSDVPYFLQQDAAICRGRGELVEPIRDLPRLDFVIVKPRFGLSTPKVFQTYTGGLAKAATDRRQLSAEILANLLDSLCCGSIAQACRWMMNRLEAAAAQLEPEILQIKAALARVGCWGQFMTGSGSTVVGVARSATHSRRIARSLAAQNLGTVLATASVW